MMDNGKREIDMLRKEIVEIHNNLAQNQTMLNNAAAKAAGNHSRLSESDEVVFYINCVHELTLQLKELERQIDILKEQDKSGMS